MKVLVTNISNPVIISVVEVLLQKTNFEFVCVDKSTELYSLDFFKNSDILQKAYKRVSLLPLCEGECINKQIGDICLSYLYSADIIITLENLSVDPKLRTIGIGPVLYPSYNGWINCQQAVSNKGWLFNKENEQDVIVYHDLALNARYIIDEIFYRDRKDAHILLRSGEIINNEKIQKKNKSHNTNYRVFDFFERNLKNG